MLPPGRLPVDCVNIPLSAPSMVTLSATLPLPLCPWTVMVPPVKGEAVVGDTAKVRSCCVSAPLLLRICPPPLIAKLVVLMSTTPAGAIPFVSAVMTPPLFIWT